MKVDVNRSLSIMMGGPVSPDPGDRIDRIIATRARFCPHATAIRWAGRSLSYEELLDRADAIAAALIESGIGSSEVVAVQLPRGIDMVCAALGVLRAGAIYTMIPLDWPVSRRQDALRKTGSRLCVTRDEDAVDCSLPMVSLDRLLNGVPVDLAPVADSGELGDLADACCVFFTSGSTGEPKSAVAAHKGVIRVVFFPVLRFGPATVMLQAHSPAWDTFAFELWGPLLNGGVSVLRESEYFSYDDIRDAVQAGVNTIFLTPSVFNGAIADDPECLAGLETIVLGGERVSPSHAKALLDRQPGTRLFNIYGPVEATICVTVHRITAADDFDNDLPIGFAVPSTGVYLLDESNEVVAVGEVGQIALSGDGVAYGYLGNPAETAERFRWLPLGECGEPVRVYLTGDFGRIDDRGRLCFEGRRDRQVKILGLRVEPREVERVITKMAGVTAALAVPVPVEAPVGLALIYAAKDDGPQPADARHAIAAALPRPFVPAVIHRVDALPVNANGKVDVRGIAELLSEGAGQTTAQRTRTPLMTLLIELEELTGVPASAESDVIDLGLTSVTALKLIGRIRATHGVRVPMKVIFRNRTPAAIADWIVRQ